MLAEGGLLLAAVAVGRWIGAPPFGQLRFEWGALAWGIAATGPLLLGLWWCLRTRWRPVARLVALVEERLHPLFAGAGVAEVGLIALLAGIAEEAFFRGVVQVGLADRLPAWVALIASGALFGAAHWLTTSYAVLAGIVGLYLGGLLLVSGNLLAPIVAHALYDLVALSILIRMKPASPRPVV